MKSNLKRIVIFAVILSMCTSVTGCGSKPKNKVGETEKAPGVTETPTVAEASDAEETEIISLETLKTIPEFKSTDIEGNEVSNEIFKDSKLTLINLWGTWCSPCVGELPDLEKLYGEMKDKSVNVIGIVEDGLNNQETVKEVLDKTGVTYTNIVPDEKFYDDFMSLCRTFPTSLLVDSNGNVVTEIISGGKSKEEFTKLIEEALEKLK